MSEPTYTITVALALLACSACVPTPRDIGPIEHSGPGTIIIYQPETRWKYAELVHQQETGFVKRIAPICIGMPFPVYQGEHANIAYRWDGWQNESDRVDCYEILEVSPYR
jgi:hypothetical protein